MAEINLDREAMDFEMNVPYPEAMDVEMTSDNRYDNRGYMMRMGYDDDGDVLMEDVKTEMTEAKFFDLLCQSLAEIDIEGAMDIDGQ